MFSTIHVPGKVFPIALAVVLGLTGCGGGGGGNSSSATTTTQNDNNDDNNNNNNNNNNNDSTTTSNLTGSVMGGIAPVTGSTVVLWAANNSGSQAIAKTTTDTEGNFSLPYTNPGGSYLLYVTAYQGNDGGAGTNDQIQMVASIGSATSVQTSTSITINELTTVAFAMSFGVSYTGANGLVDAISDQASWAASMVDVSDGTLALTSDGTLIAKLNFTANLLASCYQTDGTNGDCDKIKSASGDAASMFLAAVYWATNAANVDWNTLAELITVELYDDPTHPVSELITASEPPQPVSVELTANGIDNALIQPKGIAIDGLCNVWVGSDANPGYLTEIQTSREGMPSVAVKEHDSPNILVGDGSGGIYYNNNNNGSSQPEVSHLSQDSIETFTSSESLNLTIATTLNGISGLSSPISALAYDPHVPSSDTSIRHPLMVASKGNVCETGSVNVCYPMGNPGPMATDSFGNIFVADLDAQAVVGIPVGTANNSVPPYSCNIGTNVTALAVDSQGHVWVTGENDSVIEITEIIDVNDCKKFTFNVYADTNEAAFHNPKAIAVDGGDNIWVANAGNDTVVKVHQGTEDTRDITTYFLTSDSAPVSIAVDPMGNVWTANHGNNSVTGLFGLASPVGHCTPPSSGSSATTVWSAPTEDMDWDPTISTDLETSGSSDSGSSSGGSTVNWLDYLPRNSFGLVDPYGILD